MSSRVLEVRPKIRIRTRRDSNRDIDPLFYLHHANLDRVWAIWQDIDLKTRVTDISGYTSVWELFVNVTLDYQLNYSTLGPLTRIRDVMYTKGSTLCYEYV